MRDSNPRDLGGCREASALVYTAPKAGALSHSANPPTQLQDTKAETVNRTLVGSPAKGCRPPSPMGLGLNCLCTPKWDYLSMGWEVIFSMDNGKRPKNGQKPKDHHRRDAVLVPDTKVEAKMRPLRKSAFDGLLRKAAPQPAPKRGAKRH